MEPEIDIKNVSEDKLNRNQFAEKLADSIIEYESSEPLTIGIMGSWGSGKSSLINLTENILKEKNIITIRFNPWYFSKQDNLYLQFFKLMFTTLKNNEINNENIFERKTQVKRKLFKNTNNSIINYFNYLKDSSIELNLENLYYPLDLNNFEPIDLLQFHKHECEKYISKIADKIIVIIDDIDRLTNKEIVQIFTLVKSLADFEHFIYILSFDKLIVTEALNKVISGDNDKFIDKIIQIPISVPKISESKMDELILKYIGQIYDEYREKSFNDYSNTFKEIFPYLKLFIKDFRDLKRYKNTLNFYLNNFLDELNINDFFLILALHLFEHDLFTKIKENKELLTINKNIFDDNRDQINIRGFGNRFKNFIKESELAKYEELLILLFPAISPKNMPITYNKYKEWENDHKICSENYFEKYFTLSLDNYEATATSIHQLIKLNDIDTIYNFLTQNKEYSYNHSLLTKLKNLIPEIPKENIEIFIKALMKSGDSMEVYPFSRKYFPWIFDDLFNRIKSPSKCNRILEEIIKFYNDNVFTITEYIHYLALDYEIISENKLPRVKPFIEKSQVKHLIKLTLNKIHKSSENKEFLNQRFLEVLLTYWEQLEDKTTVKNYVIKNVNSNDEILSFLSKFKTIERTTKSTNENDSEIELFFNFKKLNTYHGLKFYENKLQDMLSNNKTNNKTKEFCETFINQLNEYYYRIQPLFISHCWDYKDAYYTVEGWIDNSDIRWKNMSMPTHDPKQTHSDSELEKMIDKHIRNSSLFIIIAGMYVSQENRNWINKEIEIAQKYNKPILAIKPWGNERTPTKIQEAAHKLVNWQNSSVIDGIYELIY